MDRDVTVGNPDYSAEGGTFESFFERGIAKSHPHTETITGPCPCSPPERAKNWSENVIVGTPMLFCVIHGGTRTIHTDVEEGLCDWAWGLIGKGGKPLRPCELMWKLVSLIPGEGIIE